MDAPRTVDIDRLRRDIDATRADIARTAGELRWKAGEAMQWQTYVERYPAPMLAAAALVGLAVGRRIARGFSADKWTSDAAGTDALVRISPRLEPGADRLGAVSASWRRLASRVEGLVNRVINEVADAMERALVPALVGGVQTLLEGRAARPAHRPAPAAGASARVAAEGD